MTKEDFITYIESIGFEYMTSEAQPYEDIEIPPNKIYKYNGYTITIFCRNWIESNILKCTPDNFSIHYKLENDSFAMTHWRYNNDLEIINKSFVSELRENKLRSILNS